MKNLVRGQRVQLGSATGGDLGMVLVSYPYQSGSIFACLALGADGLLLDNEFLVRDDQAVGDKKFFQLTTEAGLHHLSLPLDELPASVQRIAFVACPRDASAELIFSAGTLTCVAPQAAEYLFEVRREFFTTERCVVLAEIYRRDSQWRLRAVAEGLESDAVTFMKQFGADWPLGGDRIDEYAGGATVGAARFDGSGLGGSVGLRVERSRVEYEHHNYVVSRFAGGVDTLSFSKSEDAVYASVSLDDIKFGCANKNEVYDRLLRELV